MTKKETVKMFEEMRKDLIGDSGDRQNPDFLVSWWDKQQIKALTSAIKFLEGIKK